MERKLAAILAADVAGYSRLMELDEEGTLDALRGHREVIDRLIDARRGRIFNSAGDSVVAEFGSAVEAIQAAVEIQREIGQRNGPFPADRRVAFRVGLHIGDVMAEGGNLFGDGVNVAARVQTIAEPGGVAVTSAAFEQVRYRVTDLSLDDLGEQRFKNIARPIRCYRVRFEDAAVLAESTVEPSALHQEIRFCAAEDGVRIAYASVGEGPPLVRPANWMTHLEFDWQSPVWRHWIREFARSHRLVRYDERASGLSDWNAEDVSFEALVRDLEAVVDAAGLERFPIVVV
jgi:class 3 adenylate cyclase